MLALLDKESKLSRETDFSLFNMFHNHCGILPRYSNTNEISFNINYFTKTNIVIYFILIILNKNTAISSTLFPNRIRTIS